MDDIFCVFRSGVSHEPFLTKLNSMHKNLKFTAEIGTSKLAFLDTCIELPKNDDCMFTSSVFRKATYTGLILNFAAMCPSKWKFGLIQCMLHSSILILSIL